MNIKDLLQDDALKELEEQIIMSYNGCWNKDHDYTDERGLLQVRKSIINKRVLEHQKELLPYIINFNNALRYTLEVMYNKAHEVFKAVKEQDKDAKVEACCYLSNDYPALHPVQGEDRQDLWEALKDSGWNLLYDSGVNHPYGLTKDCDQSFDDFIGMNCPPSNWNEGLDKDLTENLQLINAFHNLFDHTDFAITDFIYCRDFFYEIKVEIVSQTRIEYPDEME